MICLFPLGFYFYIFAEVQRPCDANGMRPKSNPLSAKMSLLMYAKTAQKQLSGWRKVCSQKTQPLTLQLLVLGNFGHVFFLQRQISVWISPPLDVWGRVNTHRASGFCRNWSTPEDNYIYACASAVLHVRKHVLQIICLNPLTPTAAVSARKEFEFQKGNETRFYTVPMRHWIKVCFPAFVRNYARSPGLSVWWLTRSERKDNNLIHVIEGLIFFRWFVKVWDVWKHWPVWVLLWIFKFSERAKTFPQPGKGHGKGFSPVWTRMWLISLYFALKAFPSRGHSSQKQTWVLCSGPPTCSTVTWLTSSCMVL